MAMSPEELEKTVLEMKDKLDNILKTADEAEKKYSHDKGVAEFTERNSETLGKYADTMKKLNGDDFDIFGAAYDEYNDSFSDIEEATYVAQLVSEIDNKINKLKEALGESEVEIKSEDNGEVTVEAGDTEVETESEEAAEAGDEGKEEPENSEGVEEEEAEADEDEMSEEEKEFIADLEADLPIYKREKEEDKDDE